MASDFQLISNAIIRQLDKGKRKFAIFPYGDMGCLTKRVLEDQFGIYDYIILDNRICRYNTKVFPLDYILDNSDHTVLYTCSNMDIYEELYNELLKYKVLEVEAVFEDRYTQWLEIKIKKDNEKKMAEKRDWHSRLPKTQCGKYSYGPLCDHMYVEKVGAFCSFATGCDVVPNHATDYITTHPIATHDFNVWNGFAAYDDNEGFHEWYMRGILPKGKIDRRRITIGNDVWLGRNVIITNYANIGDGVIAGAGAIITKDIPDYAIVVGNPARILRYRYSEEQIKCLKNIKWWDWSDEKIVIYYDDILLDVESFIRKHIGEYESIRL